MLVVVLCVCLSMADTDSARVLGVFPFGSASHYLAFEPLLTELAHRGHNVTVYGLFPQKIKVPNFTDISLRNSVKLLHDSFIFHKYQEHQHNVLSEFRLFHSFLDELDRILQSSVVQDLINSNEKFDLVIVEYFVSEVLLLSLIQI